jgi:transposase
MILDLARQGLTVSAIARRTGHDRKSIRKYVERGLEPPAYKPREPISAATQATINNVGTATASRLAKISPR